MTHQAELYYASKEYLDSQKWSYHENLSEYRIDFTMNLKSKLSSCKVIVHAKEKGIFCLAVSPVKANPNQMLSVVEYITRANYGLLRGNFEIDYRDGEIRYKTFLNSVNIVPDIDDIGWTIDIGFLMLEKYGDGLLKNIMGFGNPEQDIAEAEAEQN